jgi:hypothetical protein
MARWEQVKFLQELEMQAIESVTAKLQSDVAKLTPFRWQTEQERQEKEAVVRDEGRRARQWQEDARSEARGGTNWSHDWASSGHTFKRGEAFRQLQQIHIGGWGGS